MSSGEGADVVVRIGKRPPRYKFFLNPYSDARFTRCPICHRPTGQRKLPLAIFIEGGHTLALNKTCRYCKKCDLLIAHQDDLEAILAAMYSERAPEVVGNDYVVAGTYDRSDWRKGLEPGHPGVDAVADLHDFKETIHFNPAGGWTLPPPTDASLPPADTSLALLPDASLQSAAGASPAPATPEKPARPRGKRAPAQIYRLKVTLRGIRPPVWRRILVPGDVTLARLHVILQVTMGWENYHLYEFEIGGERYGEPDPEWGLDQISSLRARLDRVMPGTGKFRYVYDFGDNWEHDIVVEKIEPPDPDRRSPGCVAGKRACPPEDCGGPWGYANLLEALSTPGHPEHEDLTEWAPDGFDPEAFDVAAVDTILGHLV